MSFVGISYGGTSGVDLALLIIGGLVFLVVGVFAFIVAAKGRQSRPLVICFMITMICFFFMALIMLVLGGKLRERWCSIFDGLTGEQALHMPIAATKICLCTMPFAVSEGKEAVSFLLWLMIFLQPPITIVGSISLLSTWFWSSLPSSELQQPLVSGDCWDRKTKVWD